MAPTPPRHRNPVSVCLLATCMCALAAFGVIGFSMEISDIQEEQKEQKGMVTTTCTIYSGELLPASCESCEGPVSRRLEFLGIDAAERPHPKRRDADGQMQGYGETDCAFSCNKVQFLVGFHTARPSTGYGHSVVTEPLWVNASTTLPAVGPTVTECKACYFPDKAESVRTSYVSAGTAQCHYEEADPAGSV